MDELLVKLGIDWRLLIAQLVNFLILFFLLKKFLYKPVLDMLAKRRKVIEDGVDYAEQAKAKIADLTEERKQLQSASAMERVAMLEKAAVDAEAIRKSRAQTAEKEAQKIIARAQEDAERVHAALLAGVRDEVGDLVLSVAKKTTVGVISQEEHNKLIDAALEEMKSATL